MKIYEVIVVDYYEDDNDLTIGYAITEEKAKTMLNITKAIYGEKNSYAYFSSSVDTMVINGVKVSI